MRRFSTFLLLFSLGAASVGCGAPSRVSVSLGQASRVDAATARDLVAGLDRDGDRALLPGEAAVVLSAAEFRQADRDGSGKVDATEIGAFFSRYSNPAPGTGIRASSLGGIAIGIGIGAITAGYLTFAGLKGAHDVMWPELDKTSTKPADIGLVAEDITFDADLQGFKGWYIPASHPTDKCVIFQHGHGGSKNQWLQEFVPWLHRDYNVLTFDFRGCGESPKVASSLGFYEAREVSAAIAVARSKGNASIGLMGLSMGAAASLIAGAQDPSVKGVVEDCSFSDWYHAFYPRVQNARYPLASPVAIAIEKTLELKLGIGSAGAQPIKYIQGWAGRPVFVIHGAQDKATTPENGQLLYDAAPQPKTLWMVPGADHAESHKVAPQEYEQRVLDFWKQTL